MLHGGVARGCCPGCCWCGLITDVAGRCCWRVSHRLQGRPCRVSPAVSLGRLLGGCWEVSPNGVAKKEQDQTDSRKDIFQFSIRGQHLYLSTEHRQPMRSHFTKSNISKLKTQESKMDWYICMLVQAGPGHPPNQHGNINGASFDHDLPRQKVPSVLVHGLLDF